MAYSTSNPPALLNQTIGGGHKEWVYTSTDPVTAVRVSGYFTDGWRLGMRKGDIVKIKDSDASPITETIAIVSAASPSGVDLSDGTAITATNTD